MSPRIGHVARRSSGRKTLPGTRDRELLNLGISGVGCLPDSGLSPANVSARGGHRNLTGRPQDDRHADGRHLAPGDDGGRPLHLGPNPEPLRPMRRGVEGAAEAERDFYSY